MYTGYPARPANFTKLFLDVYFNDRYSSVSYNTTGILITAHKFQTLLVAREQGALSIEE